MFHEFLEELKSSPEYHNEIVHQEVINSTSPEQAPFPSFMSAASISLLKKYGIDTLYRSQAEALDCLQKGENPLLTGGCVSGKSTTFHLSALQECLGNADANALFVLPTRALVRSQYFVLQQMLDGAPLQSQIFLLDGGTPFGERAAIRNNARILLTTPDMLHSRIIPSHVKWANFFSGLKLVCIDDIHTYRGIYGTQCALMFKRLQRILRHYEITPSYIACGLSIDQPLTHSTKLTGAQFKQIDAAGSGQGSQLLAFWNSSVPDAPNTSMKTLNDAQFIITRLMKRGIRSITFTKSSSVAGLLFHHLNTFLEQNEPGLAKKVRQYRGGFLADVRNEVENELFRGSLMGVITTNALEIGVNLRGFQACLILGYPGTVSSVRHMAGRIGRDGSESLVVFLGYNTPINQYILHNPEYLVGFQNERVLINPLNVYALTGQLSCAVHELPMSVRQAEGWSPDAAGILEILQQEKVVAKRNDMYYYTAKTVPSRAIKLRSFSRNNIRIEEVTHGETIGFIDEIGAHSQFHPGAIYLNGDATYLSEKLDLKKREALVREVSADYYTEPVGSRGVRRIVLIEEEKKFPGGRAFFGEVIVHFEIRGFNKIDFWSGNIIEECDLEMAPIELKTTAFWLEPAWWINEYLGSNMSGAMFGLGHALMYSAAYHAHCAPLDVRDSYGWDCLESIDRNTIFIFDNFPGGMGYSESAFTEMDTFLRQCFEFIRDCPCGEGCPSCVGYQLRPQTSFDPSKGEGSLPRKTPALQWLGMLLGLPGYQIAMEKAPQFNQQETASPTISSLTRESLRKKFLKGIL